MEKSGDITMPLAKYEELLTKNIHLLDDNKRISRKIEELVNNDGQKVIIIEEYDDDTFISFVGFDEIKDKVEKETKKHIEELDERIEELEEELANAKALSNFYKEKKNELLKENEELKNRSLWQRILNKQD